MRSVFVRYSEDGLVVVAGRSYEPIDNLGRHVVVNADAVSSVFLSNEVERDIRAERLDMVPAKRRESVRVVISGVSVIAHAKQSTLQESDDGSCHDPCCEWILAVQSDIARNVRSQRRNRRSEQCHAGELVIARKMSCLGRISILRPTALVDAGRLH